jgi:hypothetical protein
VPFGIEEAGEEPTTVAAAVALDGDQCMDDRESSERAHLDRFHGSPRGRADAERSHASFHSEPGEDLDESQQRLLVREGDAPVRHWKTEAWAPPAGLVAVRPVAERHPGEISDAIVVVEVFGENGDVAQPAAGG